MNLGFLFVGFWSGYSVEGLVSVKNPIKFNGVVSDSKTLTLRHPPNKQTKEFCIFFFVEKKNRYLLNG